MKIAWPAKLPLPENPMIAKSLLSLSFALLMMRFLCVRDEPVVIGNFCV